MALISGFEYSSVLVVLGLLVVLHVGRVIYSVYFGPLAKFPGPKLAAATLAYEFYYDIICKGRYTWKIKELHGKYGPIIRISPSELHIDEPDYYEELYSGPRNKSLFMVAQTGLEESTFGTLDWKFHRARRAALLPFFSQQSIDRLESMLSHMVEKACGRIEEFRDAGNPIPIRQLYMCLTTDIITLYAMNRSWGHLDSPDLSPLWVKTMQEVVKTGMIIKYAPWLLKITEALPLSWIKAMDPGFGMLLAHRARVQHETQLVIDGEFKYSQEVLDLGMDRTIFHELLASELPPEEKKHSRIWQEGQLVIGAGSDTTATTLAVTHFHILDNPDVWRKLREELEVAMPDRFEMPKLAMLRQLPYLSAIIQEGLRLSYGVSSRLQRSHPTEVMKFHDWEIPPGTPVGMTSIHVHENSTIFPEPLRFRPERWLEKRPEGASPLDRYLVSFTKGSRQCIGINLARAELALTLATVFRRFDKQELYESSRLDVDVTHDFLMPQVDPRSKGVRVLFGK